MSPKKLNHRRLLTIYKLDQFPLFHPSHRSSLQLHPHITHQTSLIRSVNVPEVLTMLPRIGYNRNVPISISTSVLILPSVTRAVVKLASARSACFANLQASDHQLFAQPYDCLFIANSYTNHSISCRIKRQSFQLQFGLLPSCRVPGNANHSASR